MLAPVASQLLDVCDRGRTMAPVDRALLLASVASPDVSHAALADLPVGRRDARLLALREHTLGPTLEIETRCPTCDDRLELDLPIVDVWAAAPATDAPPSIEVGHNGYRVTVRLPTSVDVAHASSPETLLERCLVEATDAAGGPIERLPDEVAAVAADALAEADPLADVELALACPSCGHAWAEALDLAAFVWAEFMAWAPRLLQDVHRLASAYGWSEQAVLGMSAWRRQQYLDLVRT